MGKTQINYRIDEDLLEQIKDAAKNEGVSYTQWIINLCKKKLSGTDESSEMELKTRANNLEANLSSTMYSELSSKLEDLEANLSSNLSSEVQALENRLSAQLSSNLSSNLSSEVQALENRLSTLSSNQYSELSSEVKDLEDRLSAQLSSKVEEVEEKLSGQMSSKYSELSSKVKDLEAISSSNQYSTWSSKLEDLEDRLSTLSSTQYSELSSTSEVKDKLTELETWQQVTGKSLLDKIAELTIQIQELTIPPQKPPKSDLPEEETSTGPDEEIDSNLTINKTDLDESITDKPTEEEVAEPTEEAPLEEVPSGNPVELDERIRQLSPVLSFNFKEIAQKLNAEGYRHPKTGSEWAVVTLSKFMKCQGIVK
jgi:myosin heavy subunit